MKRKLTSLLLLAASTLALQAQEIPMADQPVPLHPDDRFAYSLGDLMDIETAEAAKKNDFGLDLSLEVAKKFGSRFDASLGVNIRTQENSSMMERRMLSLGLGYKIIDTYKFDLKAGLGFDYYGVKNPSETEYYEKMAEHYSNVGGVETLTGYNYRKGYKVTDSYWRGRERYSLSLSASYKPSKRWTFTLKETLQYSHYNATDSLDRTRVTTVRHKWREAWKAEEDVRGMDDPRTGDDLLPLYYDDYAYSINGDGDAIYQPADKPEQAVPFSDVDMKKPRQAKDLLMLRSKLTIEYNVKGLPLNPFASLDYGRGLNYHSWRWKYTVGMDWKVNKTNKITVFYRFQKESDDDEPNGHLLGLGYKITL